MVDILQKVKRKDPTVEMGLARCWAPAPSRALGMLLVRRLLSVAELEPRCGWSGDLDPAYANNL